MNVKNFGTQLLQTRDLDPLYVMLYEARQAGVLDKPALGRFLISYWCNYHWGVSANLADRPDAAFFWGGMMSMAENRGNAWPRGTERRHFRGDKCVGAVIAYRGQFPEPLYMMDYLIGEPPYTYKSIAARAQKLPQFGPWIAFKVADMLERVYDVPVDFSGCELGVYRDPLMGATLVRLQHHGISEPSDGSWKDIYKNLHPFVRQDNLAWALDHLAEMFGDYDAPPTGDRPVNVQELETILCKYKSHHGGHYPPGKDSAEGLHALDGWGPLAGRLKQFVPGQ